MDRKKNTSPADGEAGRGTVRGDLASDLVTPLRRNSHVLGYRIEAVLGAGGFGITYRVTDESLGKIFALKEYYPRTFAIRVGERLGPTNVSQSTFEWGLRRFLDEAQMLASFKHPAIVDVSRIFEANGTAYMLLAYEEGPSLQHWRLACSEAPDQAQLDTIMRPLLDAVEVMHSRGVLHRDIAPDNVILRPKDGPVLIDFGAARGDFGRSTPLTAIAKPGYSPAECYESSVNKQGPWTDIYSLAATLSFLVTGEHPSDARFRKSTPKVDDLVKSRAPLGLRAEFVQAMGWGLSAQRQDRPQSIASWRDQLFKVDAPPVEVTKRRYGRIAGLSVASLAIAGSVAWATGVFLRSDSSSNVLQPIDVSIAVPKKSYAIGDPFSFAVSTNQDCHFLVYTISADDKVEIHDPNISGSFMGSPTLKAGERRQIPVSGAPGRAIVKPPAGVYEVGVVCGRDALTKLGIDAGTLREPASSGKRSFDFRVEEMTKGVDRKALGRSTATYEVN